MAHTDHLIVQLSSQQIPPMCSEISVCLLVLVHKLEQLTKGFQKSEETL